MTDPVEWAERGRKAQEAVNALGAGPPKPDLTVESVEVLWRAKCPCGHSIGMHMGTECAAACGCERSWPQALIDSGEVRLADDVFSQGYRQGLRAAVPEDFHCASCDGHSCD